MDTRIAIHAFSRSVGITRCAACGIAIHWSRYVIRMAIRIAIRIAILRSPAHVSRCIDASLRP